MYITCTHIVTERDDSKKGGLGAKKLGRATYVCQIFLFQNKVIPISQYIIPTFVLKLRCKNGSHRHSVTMIK